MKKIASLIVLALFLFGSVTAYAAEAREFPVRPSLSFSGTTALCEVSVVCYGDIDVPLHVWETQAYTFGKRKRLSKKKTREMLSAFSWFLEVYLFGF